MAFTAAESSATISTAERSLPADTTTGVPTAQTTECYCQTWLDLNALAAGDQFQLTVYEKCISGGTQRVFDQITFSGAQGSPGFVYPVLHLRNGWDITLKKLAGTDRVIPWSLRKTA